jgi:hypothetical protein
VEKELDSMSSHAAEIDASEEFNLWRDTLQVDWYHNALDGLDIAKPRIDEIKAARQDFAGFALRAFNRAGGASLRRRRLDDPDRTPESK